MSAPLSGFVLHHLQRHGIDPGPGDTPASLRERLNDAYLVEVRRLKERQRSGEIPIQDYARHVLRLREQFILLSLPVDRWLEP